MGIGAEVIENARLSGLIVDSRRQGAAEIAESMERRHQMPDLGSQIVALKLPLESRQQPDDLIDQQGRVVMRP
jgi:hypothetical protein